MQDTDLHRESIMKYMHNMKIIIANTDVGALLKATDNILSKYGKDDIPENIRGQATLSALKTNFTGRYFDVCNVRRMAEMNSVHIPKEKNDLYQTLHCVNYADMTEELRNYLFASLFDLFRGNASMANTSYEKTN